MTDNLKKVPDFDDLLFEKRNREYGAYQLRKRYNAVVITGIIIASLLVSLAVVIPFMLRTDDDHILRGGTRFVQVSMDNLETPEEKIIVPPAPPPPEAVRVQEIVKYVPPVVVDSILTTEKPMASTDDILSQPSEEQFEITGNGSGENLLSGEEGGETDEPFTLVEIMPLFKGGGIDKFREWIGKRTTYPQEAFDKKIRGTVFLTFVVEKDGSVSNVTVVKGVDPLLDSIAVKAISESPRWSPGLQRGKPVKIRFQIPLNFMF